MSAKSPTVFSPVTNTDNAGIVVGVKDVYENNFMAPSDTVEEAEGVVYFNVNGITYHVVRVHAGEKLNQPEINLEGGYTFSGWDIPDEITFDGGKFTVYAVLDRTEYTVTWFFDGKTETQTYYCGDFITPPAVGLNSTGDIFLKWNKEVPAVMPAENLTFTAVYGEHTHNYTETVQKEASCGVEGVAEFTCLCGDRYTEVIDALTHKWATRTTSSEANQTAFSSVYCVNCGDSPDENLSYTIKGKSGWSSVEYDLKLVDAENISIQPDGTITVSLPIPAEMKNARNVKIYREEADGSLTELTSTKSGSYITFTTDHFSKYIIKATYECNETGNHAVFQAVYSIADYDSGYCGAEDSGKNLQWNLDVVNGILTISGTGDMRDYFISSLAPWHGYRNYIKTIIIEDGVTSIGDFAFYECRKVVTFTITDDITRIGKYAFNGCDLIVSMYIPSSVNTIDAKAFHSCNGLVEFIVNGDNQYFTSVDGVLFDKNVEELIKFPLAKEVTEYFAPDSIKSIGADSFNGCMYLTKISFYADTIKENAFYGCENLENVTIGGRVRNIEPYAFYNCKNLKELSIYSINLTIGDWAFYKCNNLETIEYKGSQAMWDEFDFGNDNKPLTKANVITGIYTSAVEPSNSVITFRKRVAPPTANEECKHNYETVVTAPTCSSKGFTTYTCSKCGNSYNGDETEALVHSYNAVITKATCNEGGFTTYTCSVCGDCYVADNTEAIGYCDENSDGKCDNCEFDFADDCNCSCHSNGIKKLLYKLIRFFWRAFRVNNTCRCGVAHY